jgi:hypothetical protein
MLTRPATTIAGAAFAAVLVGILVNGARACRRGPAHGRAGARRRLVDAAGHAADPAR